MDIFKKKTQEKNLLSFFFYQCRCDDKGYFFSTQYNYNGHLSMDNCNMSSNALHKKLKELEEQPLEGVPETAKCRCIFTNIQQIKTNPESPSHLPPM